MRDSVRPVLTYIVIGSLALVMPYLGKYSGLPFALIAASGFATNTFEWENDNSDEIIGFALSACGIAVMSSFLGLPTYVATSSILIVAAGYISFSVTERIEFATREHEILAFMTGGSIAGTAGGFFVLSVSEYLSLPFPVPLREFVSPTPSSQVSVGLGLLLFTTVVGSLVGTILVSTLGDRDTPILLMTTALSMWVVSALSFGPASLSISVSVGAVLVAAGVTGALGIGSYAAGATTLGGALTGVLISFVTVVAGGYRWFILLGLFILIGALSTKFKYDEKVEMGVEEENEGARGFENVMGNGSVALIAVVVYALPYLSEPYPMAAKFAFAASIATATADTLSSEIGCIYGEPRLITTFEKVPRGTDGGISVEGELVGVLGAILIGVSGILLGVFGIPGGAVVVFGGIVGAHMDSLLGATLEGKILTNSTVNWLACLSGALTAGAMYIILFSL